MSQIFATLIAVALLTTAANADCRSDCYGAFASCRRHCGGNSYCLEGCAHGQDGCLRGCRRSQNFTPAPFVVASPAETAEPNRSH